MSRIRTIKPDFFMHEGVADLSPLTRLLYIGLWTQADRSGRLEDRPRRIKAAVLPYDDCDIDQMLGDLVSSGFIVRYQNGGNQLIAIPAFERHQRCNIREPQSNLPAPSEHGSSIVPAPTLHVQECSEHVPAPVENIPAPTRNARKGREGKGKERIEALAGSDEPAPAPPVNPLPSGPSPEDLQAVWNANAPPACPRWSRMTEPRRRHARARIAEHPTDALGWWNGILAKVAASPFLRGDKSDWRADPDWILNPSNLAKVEEGKYDDRVPMATVTALPNAIPPAPKNPARPCAKCGTETGREVWGSACCDRCAEDFFALAKTRKSGTDRLDYRALMGEWLAMPVSVAQVEPAEEAFPW